MAKICTGSSAAAGGETMAKSPVKELPASDALFRPKIPTATSAQRPPLPQSVSDADVVHIPSYSRWFSWDKIHECEVKFLPEYFDSRFLSKNPRVYKYFRNSIIKQFRENPSRKISFTDVRRTLVGDVGSIRRVFDFLELWGLINYSAPVANRQLKWDDRKEPKSGGDVPPTPTPTKGTPRTVCGGCKSVCNIACFACDKYDLTLCARCYVRGNYRVGVSNADFRRVEISEETRTDWSDKETLQLLEAIMHYSDDWKKVAQHVGGRSQKECVAHFIKLPFGEEYIGSPELNNVELGVDANKRMRLTPIADASNPIMAQAAFLSALAGVEIAQAAARAAEKALLTVDHGDDVEGHKSLSRNPGKEADVLSNGLARANGSKGAYTDANSVLENEEHDIERAISAIAEIQMKNIQDKILRFEEFDLVVEKEWQQLERMKHLLFADQLTTLLFHRNTGEKAEGRTDDNKS